MRSVQFRVSDGMYARIEEEAEAQGSSVARFAREATVVRAAIWAYRRGMEWSSPDAWEEVLRATEKIDRADAERRARLARQRRLEEK